MAINISGLNTREGEELFKPKDEYWHKNKWILE